MKRVQAEFKQERLPSRALWRVLLGTALLAAIAVAWALQSHRDALAAATSLQAARQLRKASVSVPLPLPTKKPYEKSAAGMLQERGLPWPDVLTALEATEFIGVTPRSIELLSEEQAVRVELVASSHSGLLEYIATLNADGENATNGLRWSIEQTQSEPGSGSIIAVVMARRQGTSEVKK